MKIFFTEKQYREAIMREIEERENFQRFANDVDLRIRGVRTDLEDIARKLYELESRVNGYGDCKTQVVNYHDEH